jgi:hypothetical protein
MRCTPAEKKTGETNKHEKKERKKHTLACTLGVAAALAEVAQLAMPTRRRAARSDGGVRVRQSKQEDSGGEGRVATTTKRNNERLERQK